MIDADSARSDDEPAPGRFVGRWRWLVVVAYLALIFVVSAQSRLPDLPGHPSDKLEHLAGYALLAALVIWAAVRGDWRRVTIRGVAAATTFCVLYGYSDELHQRFVPGRHYDLNDLVADGIGAFLGAAVTWAWGIIARGRTQTHDV